MTTDNSRKDGSEVAPPEPAWKTIRRLQRALDDKCAELDRANSIINTLREKIKRRLGKR